LGIKTFSAMDFVADVTDVSAYLSATSVLHPLPYSDKNASHIATGDQDYTKRQAFFALLFLRSQME